MRQKLIPIFTLVFIFHVTAFVGNASVVNKVTTKDRSLIRITAPAEDNTAVGDVLCVQRNGATIVCGKVIRVGRGAAILKLDRAEPNVAVGDALYKKGAPSAVAEHRSVSPEKVAGTGIRIGFKTGLNISSASISPAPSPAPASRTGMLLGASADYQMTKIFFIEGVLQYIEKGFQQTVESASVLYRVDYLELPILAKARFLSGEWHPYVSLGPTLGICINAKADTTVTGTTTRTDVKGLLSGTDIGIQLATGVEYEFMHGISALFELRYAKGLSNISSKSSPSWNSSGVEFVGGITFEI